MARHRPSPGRVARRLGALSVAAVFVGAACGTIEDPARSAEPTERLGSTGEGPDAAAPDCDPDDVDVVETEQIATGPAEDVTSGLRTYRDPVADLPEPTIDLGRLRSGGPPPDGIPSIDEPVFLAAKRSGCIEPNAPVVALEINGDARAYPLEILVWHEIVNDTVGGVPVAVEYCPLCNSVTVFDRRIEGRVLEFGVSGLLYNSSLVMYDRQTETLWSHFAGIPLYGELGEAELVSYPSTIAGFGEWVEAHPDGLVLSDDTGFDRNYGVNPYPGYDQIDNDPFLFEGEVDGRYTAMTRVVGVEVDGLAAAFPLLELREAGTLSTTVSGQDVVAFWVPGSSSALERATVNGGVDVGATGVFVPEVDGRPLTFSATDGVITDEQTGSTWNVFGTATDGALAGRRLQQLVHIDTFWFAWIAFHPTSSVVRA